jgi:Na+-driven multidrug efflux pump
MNDKTGKTRFGRQLAMLVIPITMQNLISASVGVADVFMLSFISQTAIAGVSLASQLVFIQQLFLATITTGATMLATQYGGSRIPEPSRRFCVLPWAFRLLSALLFLLSPFVLTLFLWSFLVPRPT